MCVYRYQLTLSFTTVVVEVCFSQDAYIVIEGEGLVDICVNLSVVIERNVTVTITTFSITAQEFLNGESGDFVSVARVLTFQPESTPQNCIAVSITDDSILETNEVFGVNVSTSDLGTNSGQQSASVTITNDDSKFVTVVCVVSYLVLYSTSYSLYCAGVVISLESAEFTVLEGGVQQVCVILFGQMERSATVTLFTVDDTAQGWYSRIK